MQTVHVYNFRLSETIGACACKGLDLKDGKDNRARSDLILATSGEVAVLKLDRSEEEGLATTPVVLKNLGKIVQIMPVDKSRYQVFFIRDKTLVILTFDIYKLCSEHELVIELPPDFPRKY